MRKRWFVSLSYLRSVKRGRKQACGPGSFRWAPPNLCVSSGHDGFCTWEQRDCSVHISNSLYTYDKSPLFDMQAAPQASSVRTSGDQPRHQSISLESSPAESPCAARVENHCQYLTARKVGKRSPAVCLGGRRDRWVNSWPGLG